MNEKQLSELVGALHNHAQNAKSQAGAIEDPSTRKAVVELADAVRALAKFVKQSGASPSTPGNDVLKG